MRVLKATWEVLRILWRDGPDMLTDWLNRLTDDLNAWTEKNR